MASKHTKIPRAISEFKLFLDYNYDSYIDAFKNIKPSEGWNIPFYSNDIFVIVGNLEGNLYEGIYPKLLDDNPSSDEEILISFKGCLNLFQNETWVFEAIIKKKKEKDNEPFLGIAEGIVHELLYKAIFKLKEVIQLAEEDLLRLKTRKKLTRRILDKNTICIITATIAEYNALKLKIPNATSLPTDKNDSQIYQRGSITGKDNCKLNVVFTQLHYKGIASASNTATKMILTFKPKLIIMLGHAAGNKNLQNDLFIGDLLICKEAIDYDSAIIIEKKTSTEPIVQFNAKPNPFKADSTLIQSLRNYALLSDEMNSIKNASRNNQLFDKDFKFKEGIIISGDALVRSSTWFDRVIKDNHGAIGLDMESFGLYYAAENTLKENKPLFVSLKSVSDFGGNNNDFPKNITDHNVRVEYAIDTSVNFFLKYAEKNLPL